MKDGVLNFSSVETRKTNIHIGFIQTLYAIAQIISFSLPWSDMDGLLWSWDDQTKPEGQYT